MRRQWLLGLGLLVMVTGCDPLGIGGDGSGGPVKPETSGGTSTSTGTGTGTGLSGTGNLPPTSTTGFGTESCGGEETAADPWGDEDGCGGGLPTSSPWDLGNGASCWGQTDFWNSSCEEEPCLDYDCHSPSPCGPVTFDECGGSAGSGGSDGDGGGTTTGGFDVEVDDPAALECILEALRDHVPINFTIVDCVSSPGSTTTYEVVSNGLVITTSGEVYGDHHFREQRISTFNEGYDFDACIGVGVPNYEKRFCVGMADSGPCPIGPVSCPPE